MLNSVKYFHTNIHVTICEILGSIKLLSVIHKCSYCFRLKTMATLVNYSCKSFIEVTPNKNSK